MKILPAAKWFVLLLLILPWQSAGAYDDEIRTPYPQYRNGAFGDPSPAIVNARALMNALQFSRALNNVVLFEDYGSEMTNLINDFSTTFTSRFLQSNPYPSAGLPAPRIGVQQAVLQRVLASPAVSAQIATIVGDAVLRYAAAVLPSSLSDFYMELGGQRLRSGQTVWLNNGQTAALKFFVVPRNLGTSKHSVPTLRNVAENIVETVLIPLVAMSPAVKEEYIRIAGEAATDAARLAMVRFEARALAQRVDINLTLLNKGVVLDRWLKSATTMTMDIPPNDLDRVEVGDLQVVRIGTSPKDGKPAIMENDETLNSPGWNRNIHTISSGSGGSVIAGFIQPQFANLAFESQKTTFVTTILVRGPVGPPVPQVSLPQNPAPVVVAPAQKPFSIALPIPKPEPSPPVASPGSCQQLPPFQTCNYGGGAGIIMCGVCMNNEAH